MSTSNHRWFLFLSHSVGGGRHGGLRRTRPPDHPVRASRAHPTEPRSRRPIDPSDHPASVGQKRFRRFSFAQVGDREADLASRPMPHVVAAGVALRSLWRSCGVGEGRRATIGLRGPTGRCLKRDPIYVMSPRPSTGWGGGLRRRRPPRPTDAMRVQTESGDVCVNAPWNRSRRHVIGKAFQEDGRRPLAPGTSVTTGGSPQARFGLGADAPESHPGSVEIFQGEDVDLALEHPGVVLLGVEQHLLHDPHVL